MCKQKSDQIKCYVKETPKLKNKSILDANPCVNIYVRLDHKQKNGNSK